MNEERQPLLKDAREQQLLLVANEGYDTLRLCQVIARWRIPFFTPRFAGPFFLVRVRVRSMTPILQEELASWTHIFWILDEDYY